MIGPATVIMESVTSQMFFLPWLGSRIVGAEVANNIVIQKLVNGYY